MPYPTPPTRDQVVRALAEAGRLDLADRAEFLTPQGLTELGDRLRSDSSSRFDHVALAQVAIEQLDPNPRDITGWISAVNGWITAHPRLFRVGTWLFTTVLITLLTVSLSRNPLREAVPFLAPLIGLAIASSSVRGYSLVRNASLSFLRAIVGWTAYASGWTLITNRDMLDKDDWTPLLSLVLLPITIWVIRHALARLPEGGSAFGWAPPSLRIAAVGCLLLSSVHSLNAAAQRPTLLGGPPGIYVAFSGASSATVTAIVGHNQVEMVPDVGRVLFGGTVDALGRYTELHLAATPNDGAREVRYLVWADPSQIPPVRQFVLTSDQSGGFASMDHMPYSFWQVDGRGRCMTDPDSFTSSETDTDYVMGVIDSTGHASVLFESDRSYSSPNGDASTVRLPSVTLYSPPDECIMPVGPFQGVTLGPSGGPTKLEMGVAGDRSADVVVQNVSPPLRQDPSGLDAFAMGWEVDCSAFSERESSCSLMPSYSVQTGATRWRASSSLFMAGVLAGLLGPLLVWALRPLLLPLKR